MRPFREPALRFSVINKCLSREGESWETPEQTTPRLVAALWRGELDDPTKDLPDRLVMLRVLHGQRELHKEILFLGPGESAPDIVLPPGDWVDLPPTPLHVPSHLLDEWTTENCTRAFEALAEECGPGALPPWYLEDSAVRPLLDVVEIRYTEFRRWIAGNRWQPPRFWEPLGGDVDQAAAKVSRVGAANVSRVAVELLDGFLRDLRKQHGKVPSKAACEKAAKQCFGEGCVSRDIVREAHERNFGQQTRGPRTSKSAG